MIATNFVEMTTTSGWPSGLRRQTQGLPYLLIARAFEISGPLMRAWVRIPLLTKQIFFGLIHFKILLYQATKLFESIEIVVLESAPQPFISRKVLVHPTLDSVGEDK